MMKIAIPCALLAIVACSIGAAAAAEFGDEVPKRIVNFADLNLSSSDGAAVLYRRIKGAAREVCEPVDVWTLESVMAVRRCTAEAVERAVAHVNAPELARYYRAKSGKTVSAAPDSASPWSP